MERENASAGDASGPEREWNARAYHALSDPQFGWGLGVLERLELDGSERVLDAGCGSGRLTERLAARLPAGRVVGVDLSGNMLRTARQTLAAAGPGRRVHLVRADLAALPFTGAFDAVFSTATFHWIRDHDALFHAIHGALRPRGRLVAQCGGGPNIARARERARALLHSAAFAPFFRDWSDPWHYATAEETAERLHRLGFREVETDLQAAPVTFPDAAAYEAFTATVILRSYLARLPDETLRRSFTGAMASTAATDSPPYTLDYWRLNIRARRD